MGLMRTAVRLPPSAGNALHSGQRSSPSRTQCDPARGAAR